MQQKYTLIILLSLSCLLAGCVVEPLPPAHHTVVVEGHVPSTPVNNLPVSPAVPGNEVIIEEYPVTYPYPYYGSYVYPYPYVGPYPYWRHRR